MAAALLLCACGAPLAMAPVTLQSEQQVLRIAAEDKLDITEGAPVLHLHESISHTIESTGSDGAVSAYKVRYQLNYQLATNPSRNLVLEEVVLHDESKYLAGRIARTDAANRLRQQALSQIRYILVNQKL
ncbi:hypothetical protein NQX30_03245 [Candidatus Persebacteraceae bacterium Df01]|uniref:LPS-assembly lipoprotein LptE n=1 Tax=Candidatus Doriopsillibacter californiensis TaxID=2970740 RepID=A0ABT7QKZ5_9GAMM|nr:hypothetical protein [Candidatus Persebacteraceae bacterium Df01]